MLLVPSILVLLTYTNRELSDLGFAGIRRLFESTGLCAKVSGMSMSILTSVGLVKCDLLHGYGISNTYHSYEMLVVHILVVSVTT